MKNKFGIIVIGLLLVVIFISVGYSSFERQLAVDDMTATVRIKSDIRVSGISVDSTTNSAISLSEDYNVSSITSDLKLPNKNSTITYKVSITNFGNVEMGIANITGLPSNLKYTLSDYELNDKICESNNNCNLGAVKEFYITIKYATDGYSSSNTSYTIKLDFDFQQFYNINYQLNGGTNHASQVMSFISGGEFKPLIPTKEGFAFDGWYENASFTGDKITTISNRNSEVTLYAKWKYAILFQLPPDWYGSNVYTYLYNDNGDSNGSWLSQKASLIDSELNIYSYELTESEVNKYQYVIFASSKDSYGNAARQTVDLTISSSTIGKIFVPELYKSDTSTRVLSLTQYSCVPYLHLWGGTATDTAWPGIPMTSNVNIYSTIINRKEYTMMIVNTKHSGCTSQVQTSDLSVTTHQDITYRVAGKKISRTYYFGTWHNYGDWDFSEYDDWQKDDYLKFIAAQQDLGY